MLVRKNGLILITFAWTVEAIGVIAGLVTAIVTTFPEGNPPESKWQYLWVIPMGMIAVAELGRIPLTSVFYRRHKGMQIIAMIGIIVLAGLAFENWFFGFERIVELRLKQVSAAMIVQSRKEDELADKEKQRAEAAATEAQAREEFRKEREADEEAIAHENKAHQNNIDQARQSCRITPMGDRCMVTELEKEDRRHKDAMDPLLKQRDDINNQVKSRVKKDTKELDAEIAKLRLEVSAAKKETKEQKAQNQIYRIAAMVYWVDGGVSNVTDHQFEVVRLWFSAFSALAVALAGTVAALVYYAAECPRGKYSPIGKLIIGLRAYFARRRRKIYVPQYRDGKEIVTVDKPVPVRQPYIVLVPWFIKYPAQINMKDGRVHFTPLDK